MTEQTASPRHLTSEERARRGLHAYTIRRQRRTGNTGKETVPGTRLHHDPLYKHALSRVCADRVAPWRVGTYPGYRRLVLTALDSAVTWRALSHWDAGTRPFPVWAADAFRRYLQTRVDGDLALIARLDQHIRETPPKRPTGAMAVDPATGRDGRGAGKRLRQPVREG